MSKTFISYAREDQDFVRRLDEALADRGRETWIDWKDIPLSASWLAEIYAGIEGADSYAFVISSHSLASEVCGLELAHAIEINKRLIPILHRNVPEQEIPPALASLNWIFIRSQDDFDAAVVALVQAIDTDLEWARAHTRLLVKALEWESRKRDASLTLRGNDLRAAEQGLASASAKIPQLTPLQVTYIAASRQREMSRRRTTLGLVTASLIVAIALAVAFFIARNRAVAEGKIAQSRQLSAQAETARQRGDIINAYMLADQAYRSSPTLESQRVLYAVIAHRLPSMLLAGHTDKVYSAIFSPDGEGIATCGRDHTLRIWDAQTGAEQARGEGTVALNSVDFDRSGKDMVTADWAGEVHIWDMSSGRVSLLLSGHSQRVNTASFGVNDTRIVTASDDGTIRVWDAAQGTELLRFSIEPFMASSAVFSPDGKWIAAATLGQGTQILDAATGEAFQRLAGHNDQVHSAVFSPDGRRLVTGGEDGSATVWDTQGWTELVQVAGHRGPVTEVAFSPDGRWIVTSSQDSTACIWETATGMKATCLEGHTDIVNTSRFSPDGFLIVTASDDGAVFLWDLRRQAGPLGLEGHAGPVTSASFSSDGERVVTAGWDGAECIWETASGRELSCFRGGSSIINSARFSQDGTRIVSSGWKGSVQIHDAEGGTAAVRLVGHAGMVNSADFAPDGRRVASGGDDGIVRIWDATTAVELRRLVETTTPVSSVVFSSDGQQVAATVQDGTVRAWRIDTGQEVLHIQAHTTEAKYASFSPDGKRIATAGRDDEARIDEARLWDVASGTLITRLKGHSDRVNSVVFSLDGNQIVTSSSDRSIRVWDANTGAELARLQGHGDVVNYAEFSPDGTQIVSASKDGTARLWPWVTEADRLLRLVEDRLAQLEIEPFQLKDMAGLWKITWDEGTPDEESGVLDLGPVALRTFAVRVSDDGVITFTDDEGCQHTGRLSRTKDFASGDYSKCARYPDWTGRWRAVRMSR